MVRSIFGTGTGYTDWSANFLEWTKENGHGFFIEFVHDKRATPVWYRMYTNKMSNENWYQMTFSEKYGVQISARSRKITCKKPKDRSTVYLKCSQDSHEVVKEFLRLYCLKNTKPSYMTVFLSFLFQIKCVFQINIQHEVLKY